MHNAMIAGQGRKFSRHDLQLFCSPLGYSRNIVVTPALFSRQLPVMH